ncbi:hypothetical protein [Pseudomonas sp. SBB6]|uniref:hypothetical protein n=1 Tax=Pseudomonas sp. SBB6 TaxID=2962032 RepID=UPI0020B85A54|nr:hypothetical protein [Pseudomonas sp. SBB6]MCP3750881.1 hypothetical protein [Pseudomonas sp. SBB6]
MTPDDFSANRCADESHGGVVQEIDITASPEAKNAILKALDELLASSSFSRAARLGQLLTYLVRTCIEGQGTYLNEYAIGLAVFNRNANEYNPGDDPIVRVQAGRLRHRLKEHYFSRRYPIRFDIPLGSYVVRFLQEQPWSELSASGIQRVGLQVCCIGPDQDGLLFVEGLSDELAYHAYVNFPSAFEVVIALEAYGNKSLDYLIVARLRLDDQRLRLSARLTRCNDGRLLWAGQYDHPPRTNVIAAQQEIASLICVSARRFLRVD